MAIPSIELQKAVYTALKIGSYAVYEIVPSNTAFPYITIGDEILLEDNTKTEKRTVHNITLHTWSKGFSSTESKQMNDFVLNTIPDISVSGFFVEKISLEMLETLKEQATEGTIFHGVIQFEITLSH